MKPFLKVCTQDEGGGEICTEIPLDGKGEVAIEQLLIRLMSAARAELHTSEHYRSIAIHAEALGLTEVGKLLRDIAREEEEHLGEFLTAIQYIHPEVLEHVESGKREAMEKLKDSSPI